MNTKIIETLGQWYILKLKIKDKGYNLWMTQYSYHCDEGFNAWFFKSDKYIKVITHCKEVQNDITKSKLT